MSADVKSLFPAALFPFCAGVPAIGVGHCAACAGSGIPVDDTSGDRVLPPFGTSGVSHDEDPEPFVRRASFAR